MNCDLWARATVALPVALTAAGTEGLLRHAFLIEDTDGDAAFTEADTVLGPLLAADGAPVAVLWLPEATAADPAIALQRAHMRGGWSLLEWREERWSQAGAEAVWTVAR